MRNTIFTKGAGVAALVMLPCGATAAGFPEGCFARAYDEAHLAKTPEQSVVQILALGEPNPTDVLDGQMFLQVLFRAGRSGAENVEAGAWYEQVVYCQADGGPALPGWAKAGDMTCFAECDGGAIQIARWDGQTLDLRTGGLFVYGAQTACEGDAYLAPEGRESVIFRLHPVDLNFCLSE